MLPSHSLNIKRKYNLQIQHKKLLLQLDFYKMIVCTFIHIGKSDSCKKLAWGRVFLLNQCKMLKVTIVKMGPGRIWGSDFKLK